MRKKVNVQEVKKKALFRNMTVKLKNSRGKGKILKAARAKSLP